MTPRAILALLFCWALGCVMTSEAGAPFELAPAPGPDWARLTIYRSDSLVGFGNRVGLSLDGRSLAHLGNGEYVTLLVEPGPHVLSTRWYNLLVGTRSAVSLEAAAAETRYVHVFTEYQKLEGSSGGPVVRTPGLFVSIRGPDEALPILRRCTETSLDR